MMKEVIREVLAEQGVITESTQKTKEHVSFRVGQHVFEGVITKIKKVQLICDIHLGFPCKGARALVRSCHQI